MTGLPQKLALLAGVLLVFLLAVGAGAPAFAHGSHPHGAVERQQSALSSEQGEAASRASATRNALAYTSPSGKAPIKAPHTSGDADCCCGSLMCHAGATLPVSAVLVPNRRAERVVPELSSRLEDGASSGLERPPRRPHSA